MLRRRKGGLGGRKEILEKTSFGRGIILQPRVKDDFKQDSSYLHCQALLLFQNSAVQTPFILLQKLLKLLCQSDHYR